MRRTLTCFVPEVKITAGRLGAGETNPNMFSATPRPRTGSVRKSPKNTARWEGPESPLGWAKSIKHCSGPAPEPPLASGVGRAPVQKTLLGLGGGRDWPLHVLHQNYLKLGGLFFQPGVVQSSCVSGGPPRG